MLATALRHPFETWLVRALITVHGIRLWRKGLPRPTTPDPPPTRPTTRRTPMPASPPSPTGSRPSSTTPPASSCRSGIRAWDGSEAGPADGPVLVIRSRRALRRLLWAPGELGLARAYVTGDIDVEGDLADGFRRAWQLARTRPQTGVALDASATRLKAAVRRRPARRDRPAADAAGVRGAAAAAALHTRRRDRAAISHHYDLSNDFYELLLDEHDGLLVGVLHPRRAVAARRADARSST